MVEVRRQRASLQDIKNTIPGVLNGLEDNLCAAAKEVRALKRAGCGDYADAILDQNGFGGDTAEIYFYRFAPKGSPRPSNEVEFRELLTNSSKHGAYVIACYNKWVNGIRAVQKIVEKYGGGIKIDNLTLDTYLSAIGPCHKKPDHRVHVRIQVSGQETLRKLREIIEE